MAKITRIITLMGDTCAGKTTHAKRLAQEFGAAYISTGDIARSLMDKGTDDLFARGQLSPHGGEILEKVFKAIRFAADSGKPIILDGCPRIAEDLTALELFLYRHWPGQYPCAVLIDVPFDICLRRSFDRQRDKYDTADVMKQRHAFYEAETRKVFDFMERGIWLKFALRLKVECLPEVMYHNVRRVYKTYVEGHTDAMQRGKQ